MPPWGWFGTFFLDSSRVYIGYRPTLMMSFLANVYFFGDSIISLRAVNIFLHTFNSLLVVCLIHLIQKSKKQSDFVSWVTGFLFLLHPIQTLGINFLWKRSSLLEATFLLIALILHLQKRETGYRPAKIFTQCLLLLLCVTTKESGVILPFLLGALDLSSSQRPDYFKQRSIIFLYSSLLLIVLGFIWFRTSYMPLYTSGSFSSDRRVLSPWNYFMNAFSVIPQYVGFWLFPRPLLMSDPLASPSFPWSGFVTTGFLILLSILLVIRLHWRLHRSPLMIFSIVVFWLGLTPVTSPFPLLFFLDQIRLYVPMIGLSCLIAISLDRAKTLIRFKAMVPLTLAVLIISYGVSSFFQSLRYKSPILIWKDVITEYPESGLAWEHLGVALDEMGEFTEAIEAFETAARVEPQNPEFMINALRSSVKANIPREKIQEKLNVILEKDLPIQQLSNVALLEIDLQEYEKAQKHLLEIIRILPHWDSAHLALAVLWEKIGNFELAQQAYLHTLTLAPSSQQAKDGLKRLGPAKK